MVSIYDETEPSFELDGVRMTTASTATSGAVSADTVLSFEQRGAVVSARYSGGTVVDGYLIGRLRGSVFHFRYVQADTYGRLDAGESDGVLERLPDGRLRLTEHFQWATRPERGVNIFEQIAEPPAAGQG